MCIYWPVKSERAVAHIMASQNGQLYGLKEKKKTKQITMKTYYQATIISRYLLFDVYNNEVGSTPRNHDARECE